MSIPKRLSAAILNSLSAGVVPRLGLEHIAVGRRREIETLLRDLENLKQGAASFRLITGRYGSGKTFFLQAIRNYALDKGFLVADADLSLEKRFTGSKRAGLETYRELVARLSTRLRPSGGALESVLQQWINSIKMEIVSSGVSASDDALLSRLESRIFETIAQMEDYAHGFDFAAVVTCYYRGYIDGDDEKKHAALKWLRGEFANKREAKALLPVGEIICDENWYDYLKTFSAFGSRIGYQGFILFFDECSSLYKLSNRLSRENNFEKILAMFNDVMQGKTEGMGVYMAGTPQFIEDERRGLFSFPALRSRLMDNRFAREGYADFGSPILRLARLSPEEIYVLLEKLRDIHAWHYNYEPYLQKRELSAFIDLAMSNPGADEFITPREITRDFVGLMNILHENQDTDFDTLVYRDGYTVKGFASSADYAEFDV
jgi:hypothetical protein